MLSLAKAAHRRSPPGGKGVKDEITKRYIMNESLLRWKGRIGSLKALALLVLIFLVIFTFPAVTGFVTALKNPSAPQSVTVSELISGNIGTQRYVNVSGVASYKLAYTETENSVSKAIIYPLIDRQGNAVVFVRTTEANLASAPDTRVTVTGLTTSAPSDLKNLIEKDLSEINGAGYQTSSALYVEQGQKPGQLILYLLALAAMAFATVLCIATFFFPSVAFGAFPVQQIPPDAKISKAIKATGNFQQVKTMQPLEFAKARRNFTDAVANLFVMDDRSIGVYIHFVLSRRVYGVQVSKQETDWMALVKPAQVIAVEPGKIYSWRDRWAVSIRFRDSADKPQTMLISFENAASQANFVNFLREKGYAVSSGQYAVTGSVWS